ncbi:MAG: methyl-accepting chemotaxis protein, partial [Moraxellaceae bacterium]
MHQPTMKVKTQLTLAFGALVVVVLVVSGLSLKSLGESNQTFTGYVSGIDKQTNLADSMRNAVNRRAVAVRNQVLATAPEESAKERELVLKADADVQTLMEDLKKLIAADTAAPASTLALIADMQRIESIYGPVARSIVQLATSGQHEAAVTKINVECRPLLAQLTGKV